MQTDKKDGLILPQIITVFTVASQWSTPSICIFPLIVSNQILHPYQTAGKISLLHLLFACIVTFLDMGCEDKDTELHDIKHSPTFNLFLTST
jgi:hypothetical protein